MSAENNYPLLTREKAKKAGGFDQSVIFKNECDGPNGSKEHFLLEINVKKLANPNVILILQMIKNGNLDLSNYTERDHTNVEILMDALAESVCRMKTWTTNE